MAAAPSSSGDPLQAHLERCLVQVLVGDEHSGTGFFVARGTDDLGALAVPTRAILEHLPGLGEEQELFHAGDGSWRVAGSASPSLVVVTMPTTRQRRRR